MDNVGHNLLILVLPAVLACQSGCNLFMHDKSKSEAAKTAKQAFDDFSKSSPQRYDALVKNLQRIAAEEDALASELAANTDIARVTLGPTATFKSLVAEITATEEQLKSFQETPHKALVDKLDIDEAHKKSIADGAAAVAAAQERVSAAKKDVTRWNATEAVLLKAIESLPEFREKAKERPLGDALGDTVESLSDKDFTFSDADGTQVKKKVKEFVKELGNDAAKDIAKGELKGFPKAPGADLVIMNLALELAKIQQKRAKHAQQRAETLAVASHDAWVAAELSRQLLNDKLEQLKKAGREYSEKDTNGESLMDATPLQAIVLERAQLKRTAAEGEAQLENDLSNAAKTHDTERQRIAGLSSGQQKLDAQTAFEKRIAADAASHAKLEAAVDQTLKESAEGALTNIGLILDCLRQTSVARAMADRTIKTFELRMARAEHESSIAESALNDEEWRAVISSGINGLDRYYENGVRSEDVANYIRLGQAVATGVIAGKVD